MANSAQSDGAEDPRPAGVPSALLQGGRNPSWEFGADGKGGTRVVGEAQREKAGSPEQRVGVEKEERKGEGGQEGWRERETEKERRAAGRREGRREGR